MSHTPIPWKAVGQHYEGPDRQTVQHDPNWACGDPGDDARYIVQACNAFPALIEALEGLVMLGGHAKEYAICRNDGEKGELGDEMMIGRLFDQARTALVAAKGETNGL